MKKFALAILTLCLLANPLARCMEKEFPDITYIDLEGDVLAGGIDPLDAIQKLIDDEKMSRENAQKMVTGWLTEKQESTLDDETRKKKLIDLRKKIKQLAKYREKVSFYDLQKLNELKKSLLKRKKTKFVKNKLQIINEMIKKEKEIEKNQHPKRKGLTSEEKMKLKEYKASLRGKGFRANFYRLEKRKIDRLPPSEFKEKKLKLLKRWEKGEFEDEESDVEMEEETEEEMEKTRTRKSNKEFLGENDDDDSDSEDKMYSF